MQCLRVGRACQLSMFAGMRRASSAGLAAGNDRLLMLQGGFSSVFEAQSRDDLQSEIVSFARGLGFDTVSAITVIDHLLADSEFIAIDNAPSAYREVSEDGGESARDPVMRHCKKKSVPIIWDQTTYISAGESDMWEKQATFGYRTGICLALHLPEGRQFVLGGDRDRPLPSASQELTRMVADLQLFAVLAQDAALRVLLPPVPDTVAVSLTPRELEGLRWTMEGKTAWEVGNILGISERTAVLHLTNATHKLDCVNKHQAVLKALRLKLIF